MSQDIYTILSLEDKGVSEARNIPAKLLRLVCLDKGITRQKWDKRLDGYLKSPRSGINNDKSTISYTKSNLNRALGKGNITWEKLKKGVSILHRNKIEFKLDLVWCDSLIHEVPPPTSIVKEMSGRGDDLCWFFRHCFSALKLTPLGWNTLVERWLADPANNIHLNKPERSWERGNIRKHVLDSNNFTWDTFIKAMSIIGVKSGSISVLLHSGENHTVHTCYFKVKKDAKL